MQSDRQEEMARRVEEERRKASEARIRFRNLQVQSVADITANITKNHETFPIQMYAIIVYNSVTSEAPSTGKIVYCALRFFSSPPAARKSIFPLANTERFPSFMMLFAPFSFYIFTPAASFSCMHFVYYIYE